MKRLVGILVIVVLVAAVASVVLRMRSTRSTQSALGGEERLPGSFDTWPEVPLKQSA